MSPANRTKRLLTLLFGAIAVSTVFFLTRMSPSDNRTIHFQLRRGLSAREIARDLHENGLLHHPATFWMWAKLLGAQRIRPGVYDLPTQLSGLGIYRRFLKGPPLVSVTLPEGLTAKEMAARLESHGICTAQDFQAVVDAQKAEGFLFPDTYLFEQETPADRVVARLMARFREVLPNNFAARAQALKLTEAQVVTLASLVEKEARAAHERPIIAGVFFNRLKKRMYLESCATVLYALGSWKARLLYKDLDIKSPYNTYRHYGLPPGPICNPGLAALEAAANPAETEMLFFVADGQGTHRFSRYYKDHLNAKKKR